MNSERTEPVACGEERDLPPQPASIDQVQTPKEFGACLRTRRGTRPVPRVDGKEVKGKISQWERGTHLPADKKSLTKYLNRLDVPEEEWEVWDAARRRAARSVAPDSHASSSTTAGASSTAARAEVDEPPAETTTSEADSAARPSDGEPSSSRIHQPDRLSAVDRDRQFSQHKLVPKTDGSALSTRQAASPRARGPLLLWRLGRVQIPRRRHVMGFVLVLTMGVVATTGFWWWNRSASAAEVIITLPVDNATVSPRVTAHGTAKIPPETELWLLVQPQEGDPAFFTGTLEPVRIDASGAWVASVTLGTPERGDRDAGRSFKLVALVSPTDGCVQREMSRRSSPNDFARMSGIPDDCGARDEVEIIRGKGK